LASIALLVVPNVLDQDRTTDGASRVQQYLMIAKSRAARDNLPRGIRLINNGGFASEVQYIEAPPLYIPDNSAYPQYTAPPSPGAGSPRVEFEATIDGSGNITGHNVYLRALPASLAADITGGGSVIVSEPRVYLTFSGYAGPATPVAYLTNTGVQPYPDMGAGTRVVSYFFGVYGPPQPLLGEPVQQLPADIGVDIGSSQNLVNLDLLFTPAGDLMTASSGQVMIWVRNKTKLGGNTGNISDYQAAGEQQIVSVKARSGALGVFPVAWPPANPFSFAIQGATGP